MRQELRAALFISAFLALTGVLVAAARLNKDRDVILHARIPEQGGWLPGELTVRVGEPLRLRLVSDDVTHGFAIGQTDLPPIDLFAGEMKDVNLVFKNPGKYTYYCTRWCGPNHWRMRGTIEVVGETEDQLEPNPVKPLYIQLGIDIDAPHPALATPSGKPGIGDVNDPFQFLPANYLTPLYYHSHSPAEAWQDLRFDPLTQNLSDMEVWSLVATLWQMNTSPQQLEAGSLLYAENCAACHAESGAGDGVFAHQPQSSANSSPQGQPLHALIPPANFTDPASLLGASPALLQGKILRGGMGTGMPYWGPIFTDEQTWALVSYLYTFQFDFSTEVKQ